MPAPRASSPCQTAEASLNACVAVRRELERPARRYLRWPTAIGRLGAFRVIQPSSRSCSTRFRIAFERVAVTPTA